MGYLKLPTTWYAISTALLLSLSGCCKETKQWSQNCFKVGPNYCKPAAPVAEDWIDYNNPKVVNQALGVDEAAWWGKLNDPVLNSLVNQAYGQNLTLRQAGMRVVQARALQGIAAGLLFPQQQEWFGSYQRTQISAAGGSDLSQLGIAIPRTFNNWATGVNLAWEIDLWGRLRRNLEAADAEFEASIEDYDDVLVLLIADTAAAYVQVREFEQRLRYARENVEAQRGSLRLAQARFDAGAVSELDVTQAETNLGQTESLIPILEKGLRLANNRLCVLLGIPPSDLSLELGDSPIPSTPADVVVGIPAELLRRRPDIRKIEREVAAQCALIGVAAADLFPTFSILGSINWSASRFPDLFTSEANGGFINPIFNWKILNYGRLRNRVRFEEARFQELALAYQQTVLNANAEAENAIVCFLQAQQRVATLERTVKAAQRSVELAETQYREGKIDFNRVFNLQSALTVQQDDLASTQAELALSLIDVYKALGGGWQIRFGANTPTDGMTELIPPEVLVPIPTEEDSPPNVIDGFDEATEEEQDGFDTDVNLEVPLTLTSYFEELRINLE